ncbi:MAG: FIST C-terminal domain-containing protein [Chloroflexi bacterium]|nr:FIST C-terminal domain-containing protein [Chloroflexota bacterium]MDA1282107.1 FIST C-terminal domain-containing protein [Chloroflexota bacterium]
MQWSSAVSDSPSFTEAISQASEQILANLDGQHPDLAVVFISSHHMPSYVVAPELLAEKLGAKVLIGCSAAGVIGGGQEVERRPGIAISAAILPGVGLSPFHLNQDELPSQDAGPEEWQALLGIRAEDCPAIMLLPDPFTLRSDHLLAGLDFAYPSTVKIGGLASGGGQPGANALFINERSVRSGAVGVAFTGDLEVETIVAQGCRPIGEPLVVTESEINVISKLGDQTPLEVLRDLFEAAETREKRLIRRSLQIGIIMDRLAQNSSEGEFLIRNVLGADEEDGTLAVGELVQEGQVVQFFVRDAQAADEDLRMMLKEYIENLDEGDIPASALLFSCIGRGQYLYGSPDHDTSVFTDIVADIPITGFFSNGEIGPLGDQTFLHGYSASFALFKQVSKGGR